MNDESNNLGLPFIHPAQAQKHVSFNEAISILDGLVQLVIEAQETTPPASALPGSRYMIGANATSAWTGHDGHIAVREESGWAFLAPRNGFLAWFAQEKVLKFFENGQWKTPPLPEAISTSRLGIAATADATNRFSLSSPASLFNHAGASHQIKINKASASDTASMLFQNNWSGRAEIGLAGTDEFGLKVSGDGSQWVTALTVSSKGVVTQSVRPAGRAFSAAGTFSPASNTPRGFTELATTQGGVSLGATVSGGGNVLLIPEEGLYALSLNITLTAASGYSVSLLRNGSETLFTCRCTSPSPLTLGRTTIANLNQGDALTLIHKGSATLEEGSPATELVIVRL
ncbi:DUF2793 domain-containing protein [Rhizobium helianthi]|uniref:DUF2793 domain-containing protein n=1 Tax=Rhizobium helianthi TaxID=1132695 RepID=A0ABW4M2P4_9HYPH